MKDKKTKRIAYTVRLDIEETLRKATESKSAKASKQLDTWFEAKLERGVKAATA